MEIIMMTSKYFNIGTVVVTHGIKEAMAESDLFKLEVFYALDGYSNKNWGILCEEDQKTNEDALRYPEDLYLLGAYQTSKGEIDIITNRKSEIAGDNCTTVLFPDER